MTTLQWSEQGVGSALVLLHAFPLDRSLWDTVVGPLASAGWRVIVPDLPGFGVDTSPARSIDDMADRVVALLGNLGVHSAVFAGCSMGGYVALSLAAQHPERVAGLVLIDTKASADGEEARANRVRIAEQLERSGSTAALAATQPEAMLAAETLEQRPAVVHWLRETVLAQRAEAAAAAQRAMAERAQHFDTLRGLRVPVLCVRGAEDRISTVEDQKAMVGAAGDALDVTIPGAGHLVPVEQPDALVAAMRPFLTHIRAPHC